MKSSKQTANKQSLFKLLPILLVIMFAGLGSYFLLNTHAAPLTGDLNSDGAVNVFDLSILLSHWNQTGSGIAGDLNSDSIVNIFDLSILLSNYGQAAGNGSCGSPGTALQVNLSGYNSYAAYLNQGSYPNYAALDACGYPSPNTAGAPSGTSLTSITAGNAPANTTWSSGALWVNGAATVTGYNIPGYVVINTTANVTFTNDLVRCAGCGGGAVIVGNVTNPHLTVNYSTVGGGYDGNGNCTAPSDSDIRFFTGAVSMNRDKFDCSVEAVNDNGGNSVTYTLTNSYVITDGYSTGAHMEAIYLGGGINADIENNTLLDPLQPSGVIFNDAKCGLPSLLTVKNNLIAGGPGNGAWAGGGPNATVTGNRFSGAWGNNSWGATVAGTTWSGNYVDGSGAAVSRNDQALGGC